MNVSRYPDNLITMSDAYKMTHWKQYPTDTETVYSYLESRGGEFDKTVFFGLQVYLQQYFEGKVITVDMVNEAEEFCRGVFGCEYFNRAGWMHIVNRHGGKLPLRIKACPEGMPIPLHNVLVTVENTDPAVPWLTNWAETLLLQAMWYGTTVATLSYNIKHLVKRYADRTGGMVGQFHLNDFGYRGVSSNQSAGIGGAAHLVNFLGTDNMEGIRYAMRYYNSGICGYSVFATEHSTTTIYGKDNEEQAYRRFLDVCPTGTVSVVSDSYDIYNAVGSIFAGTLKDKVLARDGRLVVRPDSGDPARMAVECLEMLWHGFGGTENSKGYRVLHPKVGVIYGDGINLTSIDRILRATMDAKFAITPDNLVFGMGGALLQQVNRDTLKWAFKCSAAKVGGQWREVYKEPVTDSGKTSKKGRLKLVRVTGAHGAVYTTVNEAADGADILRTVFENGNITKRYTFDEVRKNASI